MSKPPKGIMPHEWLFIKAIAVAGRCLRKIGDSRKGPKTKTASYNWAISRLKSDYHFHDALRSTPKEKL